MSGGARKGGLGATPVIRRLPQAPPQATGHAGSERALHQAREVDFHQLHPDPDQPRQAMDPERLDQLAASITSHGLLQPLAVRPLEWDEAGDAHYRIVAGGRRLAAIGLALERAGDPALHARLARVPVVILSTDDAEVRVLQLIENLQREDLRPVEEARAFKEIMDLRSLTASGLARLLHLSDQTVLDRVRLLSDPTIADAVEAGRLSIKAAGLAQKLAPPGLARVRARLQSGETVDAEEVARIRAEHAPPKIRGNAADEPIKSPAETPDQHPNRLGALDTSNHSITPTDPNGLAAEDEQWPVEVAAAQGAVPVPAAGIPDLEPFLAEIAAAPEPTFAAVLALLDTAALRRLRYGEVRTLLTRARRQRTA
jgi:ParB family chromosome partitioning protein